MASTAVERFSTRARELGVEPEIHRFPQGTRTAGDAAAAVGCEVGQIVKSLVFEADGSPVLALTSGANRVDITKLADLLGAQRVTKADAARVRAVTGYAIGGTPPFGHDQQIRIVCDIDLTHHAEIWAAAGTPTEVFPLAPTRLLEVTGAAVVDLAER